MKVLVVGGSGFVGKALVSRLLSVGHEVEAWDRVAASAASGLHGVSVDLLGAEKLPLPKGRPWDATFHLAAYSVPGMAWTEAQIMANLTMTARVFDHLAQVAPGSRAIFASSAFVYAPAVRPLRETDPLGSAHPYALSKQLGEVWALSKVNALQVFIVRPFNLIGPGMPAGLLVPDLLARIHTGESPLAMRGRDDLRDFLDWRDALDAYLALLEVDAPSGTVWNLCSGRATRVSALVGALLQAHGQSSPVTFADPRLETLVGDPSRLMADTGWSPSRSLEASARAIAQGA